MNTTPGTRLKPVALGYRLKAGSIGHSADFRPLSPAGRGDQMKKIPLSLSPHPVLLPEGEGTLLLTLDRLPDDKVNNMAIHPPPKGGGH